MHGLSLVAVSGDYSLLRCVGFSFRWLLLLQSTGSRRAGFSSCSTQAQQLWLTGLVAPRHVGSSWTRAQTRVPCIGRRILNHCATREALVIVFKFIKPDSKITDWNLFISLFNTHSSIITSVCIFLNTVEKQLSPWGAYNLMGKGDHWFDWAEYPMNGTLYSMDSKKK